jgi:RNA polymerase sigma factor (sigma-70 family)
MPQPNQPYFEQRDIENYRQLYTQYYKKLYNYGKKFTPDITIIEDSIQDIFLDYWKRKDNRFQPEALNSYFFSAFRYSLFKKIGQQKKHVHLAAENEEPEFSIDHFIASRETVLEMQQKIQAALRQLTGRQREALFLRFYEGLSYEEIALIMNVSVKASYKLMARSLLQLKNSISLSLLWYLWIHYGTISKNF